MYKKDKEDSLKICYKDRYRAFEVANRKPPLIKMINLDIVVKCFFCLVNSIGIKSIPKIVFVDEVNNKSMIDNLYNTISHCSQNYGIVNYRRIVRNHNVKIGVFWPIALMIYLFLSHVGLYVLLLFIGQKKVGLYSSKVIYNVTEQISDIIEKNGVKKVYVMTDHNFFSFVFCNNASYSSYLIQHGLILDKYFYSLNVADCFLAWGERSFQLMDKDERVIVCGTYKFEKLVQHIEECKKRILLYFISSLDFEIVRKKIEELQILANQYDYILKVKLHPGSFFKNTGLMELFPNVSFYKEEQIYDIEFSIGIIENSTVLIDLIYLNKPYVIYDSNPGYFSEYRGIPTAQDIQELSDIIENINDVQYEDLNNYIISKELNYNICKIF